MVIHKGYVGIGIGIGRNRGSVVLCHAMLFAGGCSFAILLSLPLLAIGLRLEVRLRLQIRLRARESLGAMDLLVSTYLCKDIKS